MYLAYPAPDDETLAWAIESVAAPLRDPARAAAFKCAHRRKRRPPARRKGSDNPLRLAPRTGTRRPPTKQAKPAVTAGPTDWLRAAIDRARKNGVTLEDLAYSAGLSARTLRRHLQAPDAMTLGEYHALLRAARMDEGGID